jgi:amino acid adenylation domain-containing protein/non-ribosomal peptide synthase protein (TIGR01720 family)
MTDLQDRIAALSPEKRTLLETRLAELAAAGRPAGYDRIAPRERARPAPLGVAQQREWAVGRFRGANNISGVLRLEGRLDLDLLGRVLEEIVQRHEVLRSTVHLGTDSTPVQSVHPAGPVPIPVLDLTGLTAAEQDAEIARVHAAEEMREFDPDEPQRLRVTVLELGPDAYAAVFATDHAASDAWSLSIIVQELAALYALRRDPAAAGLPAPEIQFADFASWQRARLDEDRLAAEVRHWHETLEGMPTGWTLPADRPRPAQPTYAADVHLTPLSAERAAEVRRFGERENATLYSVLLAACAVLLQRYLGQDDLVIGSLVSGRTRVETEGLVGCFANPLPLRVRLDEELTLREVVRRARVAMSTALDHQDLPFDLLAQELGVGREATATSLSPMWINVLSVPDMTLELPGVRVTPQQIVPAQTSVDLTLNVLPSGDRLLLQWHYMTELFDKETVALLGEQFERVLGQIVTAPDTPVWAVELAGTAPAARPAAVPSEPGFVEAFQRRAALSPHAPAVVCDGVATGYAELDREAERIARRLRGLGVGKDTPVGILLDRSPRLAAAILGVLKAGGCYIPIDPEYPAERIALILGDSGTRVMLAERSTAAALDGADLLHTLLLDDPAASPADEAGSDPLEAPDPDGLAYVVYTSGSTGRPKGAGITHRSLGVFAREIVERLELGAGDRFLQFASPSFDVLVEELFPIWTAGGAVVIPTRHLISGQDDLVDLTGREGITVMELPTAYWHEWTRELDRLGRGLPQCLRLVIIGGERVLPERLAMWQRTGVPLMHVYGLTETTVSSTFFRLEPDAPVYAWPNLPIGTPLPSAELRLYDRRMRPVPDGGIGELYIGGVSLARGYLGRPGLTAARFVADPELPGARLYRTGDLVRRRLDGNLEFLARVDTQIKIRGFRVEPTEIEAALTGHPAVAEAVVTAFEPVPGDRRLVAYVVPAEGAATSAAALRTHLEQLLPVYLVPSAFVELEALPLNANGKIDRGRLPRPDAAAAAQSAEDYVAPRTDSQRRLAEIVAGVVGMARIGIHENFFEVGGDSILAIQVVARAQESGMKLTPYELFAHPTVAALAEVVAAGQTIDAEQADVTGPVPPVPAQRLLCRAGLPRPDRWNTSVLLTLAAAPDPELVRQAVEAVLGHHDGLRQRFLLNGERTRVRLAPRGDQTPFAFHDLSGLDEAEQDRRVAETLAGLQDALDPAVGPLLRAALFRFGGHRPDRMALTVHRLVADVPSLRIVVEDLETAMVQLSSGEPLRFLPKTTSWLSWGRRISAYAASDAVEAERGYWSRFTAGSGRLPQDHDTAASADTEAHSRYVTAALDRAEVEKLLHSAPKAFECTVEELLLAALATSLGEWDGAGKHVVDLERGDREPLFDDVDLNRTVGWFSRVHPLELAAETAGGVRGALDSVKQTLRAVPAAGMGWQALAIASEPVEDPGADLLFGYTGSAVEPASGAFAVAAETIGGDRHPDNARPYPLEVSAAVVAGVLEVRWSYSERRHRAETVERLAASHLAALRALIEAADGGGKRRTAADFPLARVDEGQLAGLLSRFSGES